MVSPPPPTGALVHYGQTVRDRLSATPPGLQALAVKQVAAWEPRGVSAAVWGLGFRD